jgi:flagellar motility protein MotE (MotC chaperone)
MASDEVLAVRLDLLHEDVSEIKTALGKLSDAITKLALVEQSQLQTVEALERAFKSIERIEERLRVLEETKPDTERSTRWMDRVGGMVGTIIVAAVLKAIGIF